MKVAYICNALDSGAALFNTFNEINKNIGLEGRVFHRDRLLEKSFSEVKTVLRPYDVLVYDSPFCAFCVTSKYPFLKKEKYQISWWHIIESPKHKEKKIYYLRNAGVDRLWVTDWNMAEEASKAGFDWDVLNLLIDKTRFKKGPAPDKFTVGYLGADFEYKRWDAVHEAVKEIPYNIGIVGSRRRGHEGGEFVGREQEFYDSISCYINPSAFESGPLPPIEALQCGKPVVSTPVGMMPQLSAQTKALVLCDYDLSNLGETIKGVMSNFGSLLEEANKFDFTVNYKDYEDAILRATTNG